METRRAVNGGGNGIAAAAIVIRNLTKTFPQAKSLSTALRHPLRWNGKEVLRSIDLHVDHGEVLGLLGPNGAGKTTLLEILATLLLPTSGQVWVCGHDVTRDASQVRRIMGYCPSLSQSFYPRLTGGANLEFFALLNDFSPREAKERTSALFDLMDMNLARDTTFQCYSEGMKQKLALARALLSDPPVLLLDEPTRSLDPVAQREVRRFLRAVLVEKFGKTVLLVTHSLAEAEEVCDRLAILDRGRIARMGSAAELTAPHGHTTLTAAFASAVGAEG